MTEEARQVGILVTNLPKAEMLALQRDIEEARMPGTISADQMKQTTVSKQVTDLREEVFGEPGTIIMVLYGVSLLMPAVTLWLLKRRTRFELELNTTETRPDGTIVTMDVRIVILGSGPPAPEVIAQIKKMPGMDLKALARALEVADGAG